MIRQVSVENYRGLAAATASLARLTCIIGENNAGKSTLLRAIDLFLSPSKLSVHDYYDQGNPVRISLVFGPIDEDALNLIANEEHRDRARSILVGTDLKLVRTISLGEKPKLTCVALLPREERFRSGYYNELLKGKTGNSLKDVVVGTYPELTPQRDAITGITIAKQMIDVLVARLPAQELVEQERDLPAGIDNSITPLLPEPIYIPAVKELADDLKLKETASFGKLIALLLGPVESELGDAAAMFDLLNLKLNRVSRADDEPDQRLPAVKSVEECIQRNVRETFKNARIRLKVPPPDLKQVLSNARIDADDGVEQPIEYKGDGFKRAIAFALLRSFSELAPILDTQRSAKPHVLLYEEPELYLHPFAQSILFSALTKFSRTHQVVVSTHSPYFFDPSSTQSFIKMVKRNPATGRPKPYGTCLPIDLTEISARDQAQIVSFVTSNAAFFARRIVLVEGESEQIVFPHIAKLLNPAWDFGAQSVAVVRAGGKDSFRRYREYFSRFEVDVQLIADLDVLLRGMEALTESSDLNEKRSQLVSALNEAIVASGVSVEANANVRQRQVRIAQRIQSLRGRQQAGEDVSAALDSAVDEFIGTENAEVRKRFLRERTPGDAIDTLVAQLVAGLRPMGIHVLLRGEIENYYPAGVSGHGKPEKAQAFCRALNNDADVRARFPVMNQSGGAVPIHECDFIMQHIFADGT